MSVRTLEIYLPELANICCLALLYGFFLTHSVRNGTNLQPLAANFAQELSTIS
jgi:hypothetical protein